MSKTGKNALQSIEIFRAFSMKPTLNFYLLLMKFYDNASPRLLCTLSEALFTYKRKKNEPSQ